MKSERGFSLVEVILAMGIFMLLAGGIYAAVTVSLDASAAVADSRLKSERLDGLQRFLRETFLALPGDATVDLRARNEGFELRLAPSPAWAAFSGGAGEQGLVLAVQPQAYGKGKLAVANFSADLPPQRIDAELAGASWISLLPDLQNVRWRFTNRETGGRFQETWEAGGGRPALVNLEFNLADGSQISWFFNIPIIRSGRKAETQQ